MATVPEGLRSGMDRVDGLMARLDGLIGEIEASDAPIGPVLR